MKYDGKTVTIDSGGFIISSDTDFLKFWQGQAGEWKIISTGPGLLILERKIEAEPSEGKRVLIGGDIRKEGWLIDIISFISNSKWTGTLTVTSHGTKRQLFFDKAALRHATSNVRSEYLGEIMFRENLISRRQLDDALKKVSSERRIGEVLIRQGICTASDIFKMIYRQVEEIFYTTLLLDSGYFYFTEGLEPIKLPAILSLDTQNLLMEAVKRIDEISYFKKRIPGLNIVLKRKPMSFPPGMPHLESEFLGKCDGQKTLGVVAKEIMVGEFDAMKLAYRFLEEGALEVVMTERTYDESAQFAVRNFNSIITIIHNEINDKEKLLDLLGIEKNYINSARKEGEIPEAIAIDDKGCIEAAAVISALDKIKVTNKIGYIIQIMSQYVFFVLFSASTYLPRKKQQQLNLKVHTMIQKVSS